MLFRSPDYRFVEVGVFDGGGRPTHSRGVSGAAGLYFLGLPWLHTWGSGRFHGIARDAEHLVDRILEERAAAARPVPHIGSALLAGELSA